MYVRFFVATAVAAFGLFACSSHDQTGTGSGITQTPTGAPPTTGGADASSVDYPAGPYGYDQGNVFPNITVEGYVGGKAPWVTINLKDYYDPTGQKGIFGVYLTVSAPWCGGCQLEGQDLPGLYTTQYKKRGARLFTVLLQDASHDPASQGTVDAWITSYGTPYDIGVGDATSVLPPPPTSGPVPALPYNYVLDPRTMKIAQINTGDYFHGDAIPGLDVVLAKNGAP